MNTFLQELVELTIFFLGCSQTKLYNYFCRKDLIQKQISVGCNLTLQQFSVGSDLIKLNCLQGLTLPNSNFLYQVTWPKTNFLQEKLDIKLLSWSKKKIGLSRHSVQSTSSCYKIIFCENLFSGPNQGFSIFLLISKMYLNTGRNFFKLCNLL